MTQTDPTLATPRSGLSPATAADPLAGRSFDAVLFDLDGTLIDSTGVVERSWQEWARRYRIGPDRFTVSHGVPARQVVAALLPADQVDAAVAQIEAIEVAAAGDGITVLPGVLDALATLPPGRAAIATSCTAALADVRIGATGLPVPTVVVTADDVPVGKPDPAPYLLAAARLGVDPARCLVVEDAPAGLASGVAAGCATLALTTTHAAAELTADLVVGTLADVRLTVLAEGVRVRRRR